MPHSRPTAGLWARMELYISGYNKQFSNIWWFDATTVDFGSGFSLSGDANSLVLGYSGHIAAMLDQTMTIQGGTVEINGGTATVGVNVYHNTVGLVTTSLPLPEDVAVVVQRFNSSTSNEWRGRSYMSGVPQSFATGSYLATSGHTAVLGVFNALQTPIPASSSGDYAPANFSPKLGSIGVWTFNSPVSLLGTARRRRVKF